MPPPAKLHKRLIGAYGFSSFLPNLERRPVEIVTKRSKFGKQTWENYDGQKQIWIEDLGKVCQKEAWQEAGEQRASTKL